MPERSAEAGRGPGLANCGVTRRRSRGSGRSGIQPAPCVRATGGAAACARRVRPELTAKAKPAVGTSRRSVNDIILHPLKLSSTIGAPAFRAHGPSFKESRRTFQLAAFVSVYHRAANSGNEHVRTYCLLNALLSWHGYRGSCATGPTSPAALVLAPSARILNSGNLPMPSIGERRKKTQKIH